MIKVIITPSKEWGQKLLFCPNKAWSELQLKKKMGGLDPEELSARTMRSARGNAREQWSLGTIFHMSTAVLGVWSQLLWIHWEMSTKTEFTKDLSRQAFIWANRINLKDTDLSRKLKLCSTEDQVGAKLRGKRLQVSFSVKSSIQNRNWNQVNWDWLS